MSAPVGEAAAAYATYQVLDAAYRAAMARTSLVVARTLATTFITEVDPRDFARTSPGWLARSVQLILNGQTTATRLADRYAERVRALSVPNAPAFTLPNPRPPNPEQIRKSVEFVAIKLTAREMYALQESARPGPEATPEERDSGQRTEQGRAQQLMSDASVRAAGTAVRHITTAGRDRLDDVVQADKVAIGWARTTKPGCCYFCAMLASRGLVYKEDSFEFSNEQFQGAGEQKVHDHCGCGLRPVYSTRDPLPDRVAELDSMWGESQKQKRPDETAINAFRRMYESSALALRAG